MIKEKTLFTKTKLKTTICCTTVPLVLDTKPHTLNIYKRLLRPYKPYDLIPRTSGRKVKKDIENLR